jgi:selenocysteine-specific elongation factor
MRSIIIGTAGHIDHGKSALVAALTGKNPDRLPEEKRRGITIDLGFADFQIDDVRIGFVDVPGHERFVKNMLAGAHGIDAAALVIAADEGVMPQTREHFDICRLLGVAKGLVVLTKIDLVEAELLELVRAEAMELVKGSFLEGAPVVGVSAKTGVGLDELKRAMRTVALEVPARSSEYIARLPVDRVFTLKGFGAVVTGTLVSGEVREGDELQLLPGEKHVRARGLQVHSQQVRQARAGNRTAVNLGGVEVSSITRGMVLGPVGRLEPSQVIDVELTVLRNASRPLRSRSRIRFHAHAAEVLGRIRVLNEQNLIEPGKTDFAQIRLEAPIVAVSGDRFILRSYSPSHTIAGGEVLNPFANKHRGREFAQVRAQLKSLKTPESRVKTFVEASSEIGLRDRELAARTAWTDEALAVAINQALGRKEITNSDGVLISTEAFTQLGARVRDELKFHHQREPLARGLPRETLRERVFPHSQPEVFRGVLDDLERQGVVVSDKDVVRLAEHKLTITGEDAALRDRLAQIYKGARLEPPLSDDALSQIGLGKNQSAYGKRLIQLLIDSGELVRIQGEMLFARAAVEELKTKVKKYGEAHEPERLIDVPTFKSLAGLSRKYAIPLLEYLDSERITRRAGDKRLILK